MITIVLIHYNSDGLLIQSIESILEKSGVALVDLHFVIIDNSGNLNVEDELFNKIDYHYYNPGYNSGFARAVSYGIKNAKGDYVVLINQDAWFTEPNTISRLINHYAKLDPKTIISSKVLDDNNQFQQSIWLDNPGLKREWMFGPINYKFNPHWKKRFESKVEKIHQISGFVPRINGAFLIIPLNSGIKREKLLFDDDFFLYGEDVEWANRIQKSGFKFYFDSNVSIKHIGSYSSDDALLKNRQILLSSWLGVRKMKGIFIFVVFVFLTMFNKKMDAFLDKRKGNQNKIVQQNLENVRYLFSNYFTKIIFLKKSKNGYIAKCYEE